MYEKEEKKNYQIRPADFGLEGFFDCIESVLE